MELISSAPGMGTLSVTGWAATSESLRTCPQRNGSRLVINIVQLEIMDRHSLLCCIIFMTNYLQLY